MILQQKGVRIPDRQVAERRRQRQVLHPGIRAVRPQGQGTEIPATLFHFYRNQYITRNAYEGAVG